MSFIHNIRTVAKYEARILRRSWFFRLFSIGALTIFTFMNIGLFSPVGEEGWEIISISSSVPHINLYLLNIGQALIVIFLAADFLKRDKKLDTNEVLYTRSMSNFEYVSGKTTGILRLFLSLDIVILSIALIINIISKRMEVDILSYLWYLLLICLPTIIFSLGLAFMMMSVIRNQAITFLILLGIAALDMFWLWYRAGFIFDYMAFGLPLFKSGIIGFDDPVLILSQRGFYLCLGLALIFATVLLFKRLPQSKIHTALSVILLVVFTAGAGFCGFNVMKTWKKNKDSKNRVIEVNRRYEDVLFAALTDAQIDCRHKGETIEATARLKFTNDNPAGIDRYVFSLNPGLAVSAVTSNGQALVFKRINHIIEIDRDSILQPGCTDSLTITYSGTIDENFCFPDHNENYNVTPYRMEMLNINKRQAFLRDDYVLLTPETHWYPVPGLNYYPSNPARIKTDFIRFSLRVRTDSRLVPVAQGTMKKEDGAVIFENEVPLTGLTLAIGNYSSDTLTVDSVKYFTFYFPGNDYYKKDLAELKDTLSHLVSGLMRDLETNFSTKYPFRTLSFLEVPVQFFSYPRMSTQTRAEVQPSMVLLPERLSTLRNAGFGKRFTRQKKNMARNNQVITDKELQVRIFNDFIRNTFISGEDFRYYNGTIINEPVRYRLGPSFYFFKNNFYSSEYPVINSVFESHLQKVTNPEAGIRRSMRGVSEQDRANLILRNGSFREILASNPGSDTIRAIVTLKGDYLFNIMRSKAGIREFNEWFGKYIDEYRFRRIDIVRFDEDLKQKFGFGIYPYLDDWFNRKEQPGFLFRDIEAGEIVVGDRVKYLVTFTALNPETVTGIFYLGFRTGGSGRGSGQVITDIVRSVPGGTSISRTIQGRGMETDDISSIVVMEPGDAKKIRTILDAEPRELIINTLFARNIPGEVSLPVNEIRKVRSGTTITEGEEKFPLPALTSPGELIVDNEDPGFKNTNIQTPGLLKKLLGVKNYDRNEYSEINMYWAPEKWEKAIQSAYYGRYVLSSVFTRSGTGDRKVTWSVKIDEPGYYDVYCFVGKIGERVVVRTGRGQGPAGGPPAPPGGEGRSDSPYKDMHYLVYHDEGKDEITVDFENAEPGWNNIGRYYFSRDSAKVELTNQSTGRIVIGDAVRWVKAE